MKRERERKLRNRLILLSSVLMAIYLGFMVFLCFGGVEAQASSSAAGRSQGEDVTLLLDFQKVLLPVGGNTDDVKFPVEEMRAAKDLILKEEGKSVSYLVASPGSSEKLSNELITAGKTYYLYIQLQSAFGHLPEVPGMRDCSNPSGWQYHSSKLRREYTEDGLVPDIRR